MVLEHVAQSMGQQLICSVHGSAWSMSQSTSASTRRRSGPAAAPYRGRGGRARREPPQTRAQGAHGQRLDAASAISSRASAATRSGSACGAPAHRAPQRRTTTSASLRRGRGPGAWRLLFHLCLSRRELTSEHRSCYGERRATRQVNVSCTTVGPLFIPSRRTHRTKGFAMAIMTRWDAFQDLRGSQGTDAESAVQVAAPRRAGQDAAESGTGAASAPAWAPPVDISGAQGRLRCCTVDLPGVKVEDLDISFQDGLLTIQGQRAVSRDSRRAVPRAGAPLRALPSLDHPAPARAGGCHRGLNARTACCRCSCPRWRSRSPSASRCTPSGHRNPRRSTHREALSP